MRETSNWWTMQSEEYRRSIISDIPNTLAYGLTKSLHLLPQAAKDRIQAIYDTRTIECTICRQEVPVNQYEQHYHPCE